MLIPESIFEALKNPVQTRGAIIDNTKYQWPNGTVYYQFDPAILAETKNIILKAMEEWNFSTGGVIKFVERTNQKNYVWIFNGDGNFSTLGMRGGEQKLSLYPGEGRGSALHEIGHTLGLIHEQSRSDRDEYINIMWDNIQVGTKTNFEIWPEHHTIVAFLHDEFDFESIMLYPSYNNFAITYSKPTITKKDGSTFTAQRNYLNSTAIRAVCAVYGYPSGGGGGGIFKVE